jgi:hypothetical protein
MQVNGMLIATNFHDIPYTDFWYHTFFFFMCVWV